MSKITADEQRILRDVKERFVYTSEKGVWIENWRIMKEESGPLRGDCEDFSLTLLWHLSGKSKLKFWKNLICGQGQIWACKTAFGEKHACLKWKGNYVDNIVPRFEPKPQHDMKFRWVFPLVALKLMVN